MTEAAKSSFVYVTYIRTTQEELWTALTTPEFMKKYWFGMNFETDWKVGSPWKLIFPDGRIADAGEISSSTSRSGSSSNGATNSGLSCTKRATRAASWRSSRPATS